MVHLETPLDIEIDQISQKDIQKVKKWLIEILYISKNFDFSELHKKSADGQFIGDLVNHKEIKTKIRGMGFGNNTQIKSNYRKIFDFFRKFEKFNPRYFNATYYLINGHSDVFWGLLYDIMCFYTHRKNKFDNREAQKKENEENQNFEENFLIFKKSIKTPRGTRTTHKPYKSIKQNLDTLNDPELVNEITFLDEKKSKNKKDKNPKIEELFETGLTSTNKYVDFDTHPPIEDTN